MSLSTVNEVCYISLGCDCSVSYQLRRLGLQTRGTMPFDWMRIDKLQQVIFILENEFNDFARFESYSIKKQNLEFDYFDIDKEKQINKNRINENRINEKRINEKSNYKMVHKKYKFILPHEYKGSDIDSFNFEAKYSRRIERFLEIGRNPALRKVFIRLGKAKDARNLTRLHNALDKLGIVNYIVKYISLEEWDYLILNTETFQWQRDYIPWEQILCFH